MGFSIASQPRIPFSTGLDAAKPSAPLTGDQFYATDTQLLYIYDGASWTLVSNLAVAAISTTTLTAAATWNVTGISGYKYLKVIGSVRSSSSSSQALTLTFNGDTGANYSYSNCASGTSIASVTGAAGIVLTNSIKDTDSCSFELMIQVAAVGTGNNHGIIGNSVVGNMGVNSLIKGGLYNSATDISQLTITPASGTLTGVVSIYGWN